MSPFDDPASAHFAALRAVEELGRRQRRLRNASVRLGDFCRARELKGASPQRAPADYRKYQFKLCKSIDVYGIGSGS